jgi:hypothetical protein
MGDRQGTKVLSFLAFLNPSATEVSRVNPRWSGATTEGPVSEVEGREMARCEDADSARDVAAEDTEFLRSPFFPVWAPSTAVAVNFPSDWEPRQPGVMPDPSSSKFRAGIPSDDAARLFRIIASTPCCDSKAAP